MPPKRKRGGTRKPVSRKVSAVGKKEETNKKSAPVISSPVGQNEEAFLNFVNQNNKGNSRCEDSNDYEDGQPDQGRDNDVQFEGGKPDQGRDNGIHFKTGNNSSSSSESDESISSEDNSYRDRAVDTRKRKSVEAHDKAIEKARKLLEKVEKEKYNSSQVLRTSSRNQKEFRVPHQAPQRNKKELEAALVVIKKVMEMDEAQPFNVPVNPVALGKPDYFDVINSPMDFGTICNNLQNNIKYMNSEDVFEDVKLIWENCCKYNKKGEYIVYLVKRVKKKFMKYWAAAGLGIKQSTGPDENSHLPAPVDYTMRHNRYEPTQALGNAMNGTSQVHPNMLLDQPHVQVPTLSYSQPYQAQQHLPIAMGVPVSQFPSSSYVPPYYAQHTQPRMNQPQYSQFQDRAECSSAGHSRFQPPNDSVQKHKNYPARSSLAPMVSPPTRQSQPPQPQMSNRQPRASQHPLQPSTSNLQPSQSKAAANTDYMRYSRNVPGYPTDPKPVVPPPESPLSNGWSNEQQDFQTSSEKSQDSLPDSAMKGIGCALRYAEDLNAGGNPSHGNDDQSGHVERQTRHAQMTQKQPVQSLQPAGKMRKVRGPNRCLFLRDLPKGQRITVQFNEEGVPVGPEACKLTTFLGAMARDGHKAPLTYVNWREMPDSYKEDIWQAVEETFDIDPDCKPLVLKSLASKWCNWKAVLKAKHYYTHDTDEERLKDCPRRIVPEQWPILISIWNSDNIKALSAINKANRAKQKIGHTSGSKSYARILDDERLKRPDGKEMTRAELYIFTHTRKDGQPVDEISGAIMAKLREVKEQKTADCGEDSTDTFDRAMQVLISEQKEGEEENTSLIHRDGLGPSTPGSGFRLPKKNRGKIVRMNGRKPPKEDVVRVFAKLNAVEQKYERIENQIASLTSSMQKFLDKIGGTSNSPAQAEDP